MKVLVLGGDISPEREVSLRSSASIMQALKNAGHYVSFYDPADGDAGLRRAVEHVDMVFPILHGVGGEDGVIQKKLERYGIQFLGSNSEVSEVTFDKILTHQKLGEAGIKMPRFAEVTLESFSNNDLTKKPFVLKPIRGGSSVDTYIARDVESIDQALVDALLTKYGSMILEELIMGQEITVPVLDQEALPVIAIIPPEDGEFDYENKYNGKSQEICPIPFDLLSQELQAKARDLALQVHGVVGARHLSRTDIMLDSNNVMYVLEINTMPGMTDQSLFPKSALVSGMTMEQLVNRFIEIVKEQ